MNFEIEILKSRLKYLETDNKQLLRQINENKRVMDYIRIRIRELTTNDLSSIDVERGGKS